MNDADSTFTRRQLLNAATGLVLAGSLAGRALGAAGSTMVAKAIPSTGERLPVIGIGGNSFGRADPAELQRVFTHFAGAGGKMIDTAAAYGDSESVIGRLTSATGLHGRMFIASKFAAGPAMYGPQLEPQASLQRTLERLGERQVDLVYVHNVNGTEAVMPQLLDWKKAGKVRYIGVSTSSDSQHEQLDGLMQKFPLDFVQVNYGLGGRDAEQNVLRTAVARKIAVVANVPLGGRGGRDLQAVLGKPLPDFAPAIGATSWAQIMLKYVVSHPAVTCVITGMTKLRHAEDNVQAGMGTMPDAALRKHMEDYWDKLG